MGSPSGDLLARTAPYGTRSIAIPAQGKADYFLLDASSLETLANLTVRTRPAWLDRVLSWVSRSPGRKKAKWGIMSRCTRGKMPKKLDKWKDACYAVSLVSFEESEAKYEEI